MRWRNIAKILSRCAVTLSAHVAHSLSGSVACVDLCMDCNAPDRVCATFASAPYSAGGLGRIVPRAWSCALSLNYNDMSINLGVLTLKIITLISIPLPFRPNSRSLVCLWVCEF